jgi:hypothetical protein
MDKLDDLITGYFEPTSEKLNRAIKNSDVFLVKMFLTNFNPTYSNLVEAIRTKNPEIIALIRDAVIQTTTPFIYDIRYFGVPDLEKLIYDDNEVALLKTTYYLQDTNHSFNDGDQLWYNSLGGMNSLYNYYFFWYKQSLIPAIYDEQVYVPNNLVTFVDCEPMWSEGLFFHISSYFIDFFMDCGVYNETTGILTATLGRYNIIIYNETTTESYDDFCRIIKNSDMYFTRSNFRIESSVDERGNFYTRPKAHVPSIIL